MKTVFAWALAAVLVAAPRLAAATLTNDDSCDIGVAPAATLLLPYFEVDLDAEGIGETTVFTITNTSSLPQIAHVTLWTNWALPVLDFNVLLSGYDLQSINLYDVIGRGVLAPASLVGEGPLSHANDANPLLDVSGCDRMPLQLPRSVRENVITALSAAITDDCDVGDVHDHAVGYVTIDVVSSCSAVLPIEAGYFDGDLLFENVLIGDYEQVDAVNDYAGGGPTGAAGCDAANYENNGAMIVAEVVRFDEAENPEVFAPEIVVPVPIKRIQFPATSIQDSNGWNFPDNATSDVGGWMYMNLDDEARGDDFALQAWVGLSMRAEDRYSVDADAAWLGNGCSPRVFAWDREIGPLAARSPIE